MHEITEQRRLEAQPSQRHIFLSLSLSNVERKIRKLEPRADGARAAQALHISNYLTNNEL